MIIKKLLDVARGITPPGVDEDPTCWRTNVFWAILVIGLLLLAHLAAAYGVLEWAGVSRVAQASELVILDNRSKAILKAIYSPQIRAKIRERCDADTPAARERVNVELDRLKNEYRAAAGVHFKPMPTCNEV